MERAIMNVISNALDHSPPQGTIYVTVQKTDCFLHISITDEGGGFTPEALHHAQEQFFMGDKSRRRADFFLFWRAGGYYTVLEECGKM